MQDKRILLIIGGGIAAYKSLDLIRRLQERGASVRVVMTRAAQHFVTSLAAGALSGSRVFTDLFDADSEFDVGHIRLARDADLVLVAPATADLMAKMAGGHADDLASTILLATDKPVLLAPAMNPHMWLHQATRRNVDRLEADGISFIGPNEGEMAEGGETGRGRMAEPLEIVAAAQDLLGESMHADQSLACKRVLVTTGPTHEPIDPVRYIANRSSGKQGMAIARAAARHGADVVMVSGPTNLLDPSGVKVVRVETAEQMLQTAEAALPADVAICAAAVADWRAPTAAREKIKKATPTHELTLELVQNPDILQAIAHPGPRRPELVVGFAAETENVVSAAKQKRIAKNCDWIVANDVSAGTGVMGGDRNTIHLVTAEGVEDWPEMTKDEVAERLMQRIAATLSGLKSAAE